MLQRENIAFSEFRNKMLYNDHLIRELKKIVRMKYIKDIKTFVLLIRDKRRNIADLIRQVCSHNILLLLMIKRYVLHVLNTTLDRKFIILNSMLSIFHTKS